MLLYQSEIIIIFSLLYFSMQVGCHCNYDQGNENARFLSAIPPKAHNTEHPSRGCPHQVLISQLSRLTQL